MSSDRALCCIALARLVRRETVSRQRVSEHKAQEQTEVAGAERAPRFCDMRNNADRGTRSASGATIFRLVRALRR